MQRIYDPASKSARTVCSGASFLVELKMDCALLQASVQDYIEGGHETWVTSGEEDGIFF